jgi:GTP-binding protein
MTSVVEAQFLAAVGPDGAFLPPTLPEVAFAGRSNVGKSSLINTLVGRRGLARTSSTPGCTRSINFFHIRAADGLNFQLVDLPGYGYAKRSKAERASWGPLLERYLLERAPLRAVVLLVDVRRGLEDEEEALLEFLRQPSKATRPKPGLVLVATKIDKLPLAQRHGALAKLKRAGDGAGAIGFSSVTRDGVDPLWKRLRYYLLGGEEAQALPEATSDTTTPAAEAGQPVEHAGQGANAPSATHTAQPEQRRGSGVDAQGERPRETTTAQAGPKRERDAASSGQRRESRPGTPPEQRRESRPSAPTEQRREGSERGQARGGRPAAKPGQPREGRPQGQPREGRPSSVQAANRGPSQAHPRKGPAPGGGPRHKAGPFKGRATSSQGRKAPR